MRPTVSTKEIENFDFMTDDEKFQITQHDRNIYIFLVITSTRDYREREYIEMRTRFVYIGTVFLW